MSPIYGLKIPVDTRYYSIGMEGTSYLMNYFQVLTQSTQLWIVRLDEGDRSCRTNAKGHRVSRYGPLYTHSLISKFSATEMKSKNTASELICMYFIYLIDIIFSSRKNAKGLRASSYEPSWGSPCPSSLSDHHRFIQLIIFAWNRLKERTNYQPVLRSLSEIPQVDTFDQKFQILPN